MTDSANERKSLVYRSPRIYHAAMKIVYGFSYRERYEEISALIGDSTTVLDVCCGDGELFSGYLARKNVKYTGLDINGLFVDNAKSRGIDARVCDIRQCGELPRADTVVMQGSLYQFYPDCAEIVERLIEAAAAQLIIAEPVKNWSTSTNPLLRLIGVMGTDPGTGRIPFRFDEQSLEVLLGSHEVVLRKPVCRGREMIYQLKTSHRADSGSIQI